jgi:hypothetical protein
VLFLSYAEEDERAAAIVAEGLRARGHEIYDWRDRERKAGLFIREIEDAIQRVDAYVALLSPNFMASPLCRREWELALQRELDLQAGDRQRVFVFVLRITPGHYADAGFLRSHGWLDLKPSDDNAALDTLHGRLGGIDQGEPMKDAAGTGAELAGPLFRNRRQELDRVLGGLLSPVRPHFWLVVAPPQLGKTWFLHRISAELEEQSPGWTARMIDMSDQPAKSQRDARGILAQFFPPRQADTAGFGLSSDDIAKMILCSNKAHLCLIDSAELLDERTITSLRRTLDEIHRLVEDVGREDVWLAVIVASRREEHWRGMNPLLAPQALTEFPPTIVQQALRDLAKEMRRNAVSTRQFSRWSNQIHRQSEGLPRVLVAYLRWIRENEWVGMRRLGSPELFAELGHPYIRDELLSADSLIPVSADQDGMQHRALMEAFRVLAPYRLFTRFHLTYHNDLDSTLQGAVAEAGWTIEDLWKAISGTALLEQPLDELWQAIYPAIRRLLFRYYYDSSEKQSAAHLEGRKLMEAWAGEQNGKEQAVGLVECLWHEAGELRLGNSAEMKQKLMDSAAKLSRAISPSNAYTVQEVREYTRGRLLNDEEFRQNSGLPASLLRSLAQIIAAPDPKELPHD